MFKNNINIIFRQFENILYFEIFKCLISGLVRFGFGLCRKIAVWFGSKFFVMGLVRFWLHFEDLVQFGSQNWELVTTLILSKSCLALPISQNFFYKNLIQVKNVFWKQWTIIYGIIFWWKQVANYCEKRIYEQIQKEATERSHNL
jgi:hypothetical protein